MSNRDDFIIIGACVSFLSGAAAVRLNKLSPVAIKVVLEGDTANFESNKKLQPQANSLMQRI